MMKKLKPKGCVHGEDFRPREERIGKNEVCLILSIMGFTEVGLHVSFIEN
jgi:hypothetical protein